MTTFGLAANGREETVVEAYRLDRYDNPNSLMTDL